MNIALVGNPNVGKSVIFNALTGNYVTVSNYPGTTVDISKGTGKFGARQYTVIDTPGVNSLVAHSEDEKVTKEILSRSDTSIIVQVADSKNLKRSLLLTLELIELGMPLVLCLNMSDEAKERGIAVDVKKLSDRLGVIVVETVAVTGDGLAKLKDAIIKTKAPSPAVEYLKTEKEGVRQDNISLIRAREKVVAALLKDVLKFSKPLKEDIAEAIGRITTRPITGVPILLGIMVLMYFFVGKFAAGTMVDFFENTVFGKIVNPFFIATADRYIGAGLLRDFLIGNYGILTMALTYAFAIIFPIVTAFFIFFGILEDSGYLPRLSVLSDIVFKTIGLNGRAILPIILGLGCGTMATLTARILDTKKERILVSIILTLAIPCSAQLGVILGMLGSVSVKALVLWLIIMLSVLMAVGFIASRVVPGARSPFIQEIPPIRMPQAKNILVKTFARLKWYLKEAVPLFLLGTALLFVLDAIGALKAIESFIRPVVVGFLGLPEKATEAFIIGFLRRDYGAAGLYALSKSGALDTIQILVSVVVITLFVPCVAQFFVTVKERGVKVACLIGGFVFIFAFLFGGVLNYTIRHLLALGIAVI
ncbi:MAG: ferrous iron transporter B [Candidatus Omnitrophota bacterium]|nr:ferrous iron transporter B [Candidatus Omnitrophota bacterium]